MKQLKIMMSFILLAVCGCTDIGGGLGCTFSNPYYLEIENLTGETARVEFHERREGEFSFTLPSGEERTVFRGSGSLPEKGEEGSPLPKNPIDTFVSYDSIVVVVGDRREAFFRSIACSRSDGCDPPVFENSPDWESSWNPFIRNNWELVEEPRDLCNSRSGSWGRRFFLRPK